METVLRAAPCMWSGTDPGGEVPWGVFALPPWAGRVSVSLSAWGWLSS